LILRWRGKADDGGEAVPMDVTTTAVTERFAVKPVRVNKRLPPHPIGRRSGDADASYGDAR
jgi:hypothetical protein